MIWCTRIKIGGILVESVNSDGKFLCNWGRNKSKTGCTRSSLGRSKSDNKRKERLKFIKFVLKGYQN